MQCKEGLQWWCSGCRECLTLQRRWFLFTVSALNGAATQMGGKKWQSRRGRPIGCICCGSCSGDGQLWRPCEKLKGNFSRPANLTPLLRMNQKRNTLVEQKEGARGRESEQESETSCLEVPHLYTGTATHAHNHTPVSPQSNAQFAFTEISEMFLQGQTFYFWGGAGSELGCPLAPLKYIWGVARADNKGPL